VVLLFQACGGGGDGSGSVATGGTGSGYGNPTPSTGCGSSGTQISGTATLIGNFCVAVTDVGNLVEPVTYTITVLHS
jgi:hypothetical protein